MCVPYLAYGRSRGSGDILDHRPDSRCGEKLRAEIKQDFAETKPGRD